MSDTLTLDGKTTAFIAIDLQRGILARHLQPYPAATIVANAVRLADRVRSGGGLVVWVNVLLDEVLPLPADKPSAPAGGPPPPPEASELVPEIDVRPGDVRVSKRQRGAFYGTALDQHLRRRRIETVILAGVATNIGVESTARAAHDHGYAVVFAEDAMTSVSAEMHAFATGQVFRMTGRVRRADRIVLA